MKIYSDTITTADILAATQAYGMTGVEVKTYPTGTKVRKSAYVVHLTGTSSRRPNAGNPTRRLGSLDYAATWDEWGMFFAALYTIDPHMIVGTPGRPAYANAEMFHLATGYRFRTLTADEQHGKAGHRWEAVGDGSMVCRNVSCTAEIHQKYMYRKNS